MELTDIRVKKVPGDKKLKAYVSVTFDNCFVVHNVKIVEGNAGLFVAMPSRKTKRGDFKDIAHPISADFRAELQKKVLDIYDSGAVQDDPGMEILDV